MAKAKGNSYVGSGGSRSNSFGSAGSLGYGALRNTISRRDASNLARRKSIGGKLCRISCLRQLRRQAGFLTVVLCAFRAAKTA